MPGLLRDDPCFPRGVGPRIVPRVALFNLETFPHLPGSVPISPGQGPISSWKDSLSKKGQTSTLSKVPSFLMRPAVVPFVLLGHQACYLSVSIPGPKRDDPCFLRGVGRILFVGLPFIS